MSGTNLPPFKVICINNGEWYETTTKIICLFFRKDILKPTVGPRKEEVCIVTERHQRDSGIYYRLQGYELYGIYNAKHFSLPEEKFQSISLEKVLEKETPLISTN